MQTDQFTPIHNEVIEALCKINLSAYEWRVLMAILRKTYGYKDPKTGLRKKVDVIALSQFTELTGLDRRLVNRSLQSLIKKGVVSRDVSKTGLNKAFVKRSDIDSDVRATSVEMSKVTSVEMYTKEIKENTHTASLTFLKNITQEDLAFLKAGLSVTDIQIRDKADDLLNYCESKGRVYKNYRALLRNALKKDYPRNTAKSL